jgi:hypothetical protein
MALNNTVKGMSQRQKEKRMDLRGMTTGMKKARKKAIEENKKKRKRYTK